MIIVGVVATCITIILKGDSYDLNYPTSKVPENNSSNDLFLFININDMNREKSITNKMKIIYSYNKKTFKKNILSVNNTGSI
jgi:hypothetical protein